MLQNKTELLIGPLKYTHVVQKINMQERKSVEVLETARTDRNFIKDLGESEQKAQIRLLFTGLDEINRGIGSTSGTSGLRGLIALFRCCPIVSIKNDTISLSWGEVGALQEPNDADSSIDGKSKVYNSFIPVALESIELENVPDLPNSIQVTLNVARIDVRPVTTDGNLQYLTDVAGGSPADDPRDAYWLKKWIEQILDSGGVMEISADDFKEAEFNWYGSTIIGTPIQGDTEHFTATISSSSTTSECLVLSEACSLRHRFAYNKLLGKGVGTPAHMGISSRMMSLDLVFNNQESDNTYRKFIKFKETSDRIIKSENRLDRVVGWYIKTPISKLLGIRRNLTNSAQERPGEGVYVPLNILTENGDQPNMINCRIDLAENNIDFFKENEIVLTSGGTDYDGLKQYYDLVVQKEFKFRTLLIDDNKAAIQAIVGDTDNDLYSMYTLLWPIERQILKFKEESRFGIVNADSIRAAFLHHSIDKEGKLRDALLKSKISTGKVFATRRITFGDKVYANWNIVRAAIAGINLSDPEVMLIREEVSKIVDTTFLTFDTTQDIAGIKADLADLITGSFLGDRTSGAIINDSLSATVIATIAKNKWKFHPDFADAIFKVIVERSPKPPNLPYAYSTDGIYSGFAKLINSYVLNRDGTESNEESRLNILDQTRNKKISSMYPDLVLPTYSELFGEDRWQEFAPTIDDLGIETFNQNEPVDRAKEIAVSPDDIVSPACWFYVKRTKNGPNGLKTYARTYSDAVNQVSPALSLSLRFNTEEIDDLKELTPLGSSSTTRGTKTNRTLSQIIQNSLEKHSRSNPAGYREDIVNLATKFEQGFYNNPDNGSIKVYIHHNGSHVVSSNVTVPGLGAEIYKVAKDAKILEGDNSKLGRTDADESLVTPLQREVKFHRHLNSNTEKVIQSSIDQVPDDQYSPERMFPAIKVYLVDRRGNDIIADDTLFSVTALVSVDITMDKDDAPLAVIKLADPLYSLQDDYFDSRNVVGLEDKEKKILNTLRAPDLDSYSKRYKLVQGRSVQIRMGYSSMAYNLPIVFTGRITEIVPGDQLTIVAQGWKAELINRQVNFYNDDPKNWGARDLAIQAITYSSADGFGDFYPEHDAQFILRQMNAGDVTDMVQRVIQVNQNVDLEGRGTRGIGSSITNWIKTTVGLRSNDKDNRGFDTRLKNIWYPDTELFNNVFGLSTKFGLMPSFMNDSWVIPLQPAWDVLQEASRHAWNCIVDVVPYDTYATIFMGHPDQPYFYTRGTSLSRKLYNKYKSSKTQNVRNTMHNLINTFLNSDRYFKDIDLGQYNNAIQNNNTSTSGLTSAAGLGVGKVSLDLVALFIGQDPRKLEGIFSLKGFAKVNNPKLVENSGLPLATLQKIKDLGLYDNTEIHLFSYFYGIPIDQIISNWPSASRDIQEILSVPDKDGTLAPYIESILNGLGWSSSYGELIDQLNTYKLKIGRQLIKLNSYDTADGFVDFGELIRICKDLIKFVESVKSESLYDKTKKILDLCGLLIVELEKNNKRIPAGYRYYINGNSDNVDKDPRRLRFLGPPFETRHESHIQDNTGEIAILYRTLNQVIGKVEDTAPISQSSILKSLGIDIQKINTSRVIDNLFLFKAFVYYFCLYASENSLPIISSIEDTTGEPLPPNMKVFRVHHFTDNDHNIIQNNIVASTREMWNTVVIEHPAPGSAETVVSSSEELYTQGRINAGANWLYYPKQEVTGVIGLQYHPGLTLSNKKIQVFTELNCQSPDLAAKLACNRLAEGIKKMYRGNLLLLGKHIKPHDRIILADKYTKMKGPVEVESVIHHWNAEQGWITNITPAAVCDANPGAGILHTAILETTYQAVYNTLDYVSDILTWATVIATLGAATPLAAGKFSVSAGLKGVAKRFLTKNPIQFLGETASIYGKNIARVAKGLPGELAGTLRKGHRLDAIRYLYKEIGGPGNALLANEMAVMAAEFATHSAFQMNIIPSYVESANNVEQLPIILSPLIYNNTAFVAGLEAEDSIWGISAFGLFWSMKEAQAGISRVYKELFEEI